MKKVLIALDYDPSAQLIAETGYELAKALGAQVILLHVVSNEVYYSTRAYTPIMGFAGFTPAEHVEGEMVDHLKDAATSYLEKTRKHLKDEGIEIMVKEGDFGDMILETAELTNAGMIVLGSASKNWLEKMVMGSVAEQVLKSARVPLLIIPVGKEEKDS